MLNIEGGIGRALTEKLPKKLSETTGGSGLSLTMELRAQIKCI